MKTGLIKAYVNIPGVKSFKYHGINSNCNKQPDPDPLLYYENNPPYGPEVEVIIKYKDIRMAYKKSYNYNTVWSATSGSLSYNVIGNVVNTSGRYSIYRYFMIYDTSVLPINCLITKAIIKPYIGSLRESEPWCMQLQWGNGVYPHYPIVSGDYNQANYSGNYGQNTNWGIGLVPIELTSAGIGLINKLGLTKFALRNNNEINYLQPSGFQDATIVTGLQSLYFWITYRLPL